MSKYISSDELNGGRGAFLSSELRGEHPEAYGEKWLEDLTVFDHEPDAHDAFARWVVMPVLKSAHHLWLGKRKVSWFLHCVSGSVLVPGVVRLWPLGLPPKLTSADYLAQLLQKPIHADIETGLNPAGTSNEKTQGENAPVVVPLYQYNATSYAVLNRTLNAIVVILIPCAAVVSLNAVHDPNKRIGMICAFSLVCAIGMALCSGASRIEIFAVSAA